MNKAIIAAALSLLFVFASFAQSPCTRHYERAGGFSYCPPAGWSPKDSPNSPYKTFVAPRDSLLANFNVKTEASSLSHAEYMVASLRILLDGNEVRGEDVRKIIGWTEFKTASGISGSRMVYEFVYKGISIRTIQVVLDLPGKKLLITGTAQVTDKATTDKIFDAVAATAMLGS